MKNSSNKIFTFKQPMTMCWFDSFPIYFAVQQPWIYLNKWEENIEKLIQHKKYIKKQCLDSMQW